MFKSLLIAVVVVNEYKLRFNSLLRISVLTNISDVVKMLIRGNIYSALCVVCMNHTHDKILCYYVLICASI